MIKTTFRRFISCNKTDTMFEREGNLPSIPPIGGTVVIKSETHTIIDVCVEDGRAEILVVVRGSEILYKSTYNRAVRDIKKDGWSEKEMS